MVALDSHSKAIEFAWLTTNSESYRFGLSTAQSDGFFQPAPALTNLLELVRARPINEDRVHNCVLSVGSSLHYTWNS